MLLVVGLVVGAAYGVLDLVFEITVLQALVHERIYPGFDVSEYTQPFYGAFVLDPDGFKLEAVCRR